MKTTGLENLKHISQRLSKIHKLIIDHQFAELEASEGQPILPGTRLQLLLNGAEFAWLRPLSQLITEIDGIIFQKTPVEGSQIIEVKKSFYELLISKTNETFSVGLAEAVTHISALPEELSHATALYEKL